jgi:hypothetical protein
LGVDNSTSTNLLFGGQFNNLMRNLFLFITIFSPFVFCSCNSPLGRKYNPRTFENDISEIRQSNKVSNENMELLIKYVVISKLSGNDLQGQTYNDILDKVKGLESVSRSANSQQENVKLEKRQRLNKFLKVNLERKDFIKVKNKDVLSFSISFKNLGKKHIATIIGSITLNDLLEKEIKKINILLDDEIETGATFTKTYTFNYDDTNEGDRRIRSKALIDMRIEWNPEKIIFKDGKTAD